MKTFKNNEALNPRNQLQALLQNSFDGHMNLARVKFFGLFICALCKVQNVCFEKLASAFDSYANRESSLCRIQRFMSEYVLDHDLIARLIFSLLPHDPPYTLTLDRTDWKFGKTNINILMLAIVYKGVAFPVLFHLTNKAGTSSTNERIELMQRHIDLFGTESIESLVADRELIGKEWIGWLNDNSIRYHIRCRNNFRVFDFKCGKTIPVKWLFLGLPLGEVRVCRRLFRINGQLCYLSGSRIRTQTGIEHQIIISFNKPERAHATYKERWQIECAFKSLKSSGFNIENTHLTAADRLEKLFSLLMVAFTWAYLTGLYIHENLNPIRMLKHGYKAKTFFKYGLETIAAALLNPRYQQHNDFLDFLSCS